MKKTFSFLSMLCAVAFVNAQITFSQRGSEIALGDTVLQVIDRTILDEGMAEFSVDLINQTNEDITSTLTCDAVYSVPMIVSGMCAEQCVEGNTSGTFTIPANGTYPNFHVEFIIEPNAVHGDSALFCLKLNTAEEPAIYIKYVVDLGTGIDEVASTVALNAYPNPAHHQVNINYTLPEDCHKGTLVVYDIVGKRMASHPLASNSNTATIDITSWPYGVYMYGIIVDNKLVRMKKFVVE